MPELVEFRPPDNSGFVMTPNAEATGSVLTYSQRYSGLGLIVGDPGAGKTMAIQHYADTHDHVTLAEMHRLATRSFGPALELLCRELGCPPRSGDFMITSMTRLSDWFADLWDGVEEHRPLVIIDEAQYLPESVVDYLRHCWKAERGVGLVLVGNDELRRRFSRAKDGVLAPFDSRLGPRLDLPAPGPADVAAICRARGIQGAREAACLQRHAEAGGLRRVDEIITAAKRCSPGEAIRLPQLQTAILFLGL